MSDKIDTKALRKNKLQRKGEKDLLTGDKKKRGVSDYWLRPVAVRSYILIGLSMIIALFLFPSILTRPDVYRLGDVAQRDVKASQEFLIEDNELTEKNRQDALRTVLPVYDFDPTSGSIIARIKESFKTARRSLPDQQSGAPVQGDLSTENDEEKVDNDINRDEPLKTQFFESLDIVPDDGLFDILMKSRFPPEVEKNTVSLVTQIIEKGVVNNKLVLMRQGGKGITLHNIQTGKETEVNNLEVFLDLAEVRSHISAQSEKLLRSMSPYELVQASQKLAIALIKPNITANIRETELRKDLAWKSVKPFYFKVKKGEMLVREGERIAPEHLLKLTGQYKLRKQNEMLGRAPAMAILILLLISATFIAVMAKNRSVRFEMEVKDLCFAALTLFVVFLLVVASNFVAYEIARSGPLFSPRALLFAIPVASGAMLISIFQGMNVAIGFSLVVSALACLVVGGRVEFFIYFFITSLVGAHGVVNCRERSVFIKTALKIGLLSVVLALSIVALYGSVFSMEALVAGLAAFLGGILAGVIATGILPLIEMSFGYTTDIKLLELANLEQPLLRRLMVQAPGTHHHSVIVSNMVEATAESVNANPLIAKVAAYYHDIGKMKKPLYFIENQKGRENKHEKLAPSMSSLILISHVKDGVELAVKHKLGKEIIDIIKQHHGTSLISFFYEKAREQTGKRGDKSLQVKEEDFRYPGPKPQTKEAGLVMLADVVEAASRTLVDPTTARIQGMVQTIINRIFSDGQLDECELTLRDLHEIARSFNKTLSGIFHHRIEYPDQVKRPSSERQGMEPGDTGELGRKKRENGSTDQLRAEDIWTKRPEDEEESRENLKRLGM
ncbi:MAG: HDIG domain-containing metalloprotein [Desulfatiglans sp.]|nr:HDIG domain-containing protein [Thermodesulfobacteriota bacterium]MEE4353281.1 HDIG domain-containing metalloprotein [Desulfatiglans sp.]